MVKAEDHAVKITDISSLVEKNNVNGNALFGRRYSKIDHRFFLNDVIVNLYECLAIFVFITFNLNGD